MKGIILAAGKGSRIANHTQGVPKSFLEINGKRIIDWQIEALHLAGIKEIIIVIGYKVPLFEKEYGSLPGITLVKNPFYESCNVLGSLWFTQKYMTDDFFFMHADTLYDSEILNLLNEASGGVRFAIEYKETCEEEMKVKVEGNRIYEVNKTMNCSEAAGEFTGVARISKEAIPYLIKHMNHLIEVEKNMFAFFEVAIQEIINKKELDVIAVDIEKYRSVEVDFSEDYERAVELFS